MKITKTESASLMNLHSIYLERFIAIMLEKMALKIHTCQSNKNRTASNLMFSFDSFSLWSRLIIVMFTRMFLNCMSFHNWNICSQMFHFSKIVFRLTGHVLCVNYLIEYFPNEGLVMKDPYLCLCDCPT